MALFLLFLLTGCIDSAVLRDDEAFDKAFKECMALAIGSVTQNVIYECRQYAYSMETRAIARRKQ